jgi:hypothetical protein
LATRVSTLLKAGSQFGVVPPADFASYFDEPTSAVARTDEFLIRMADQAVVDVIDDLIRIADSHVLSMSAPLPDSQERNRIAGHFLSLSPAPNIKTFSDIINAGWSIRLKTDLWQEHSFDETTRNRILNDLVFKTIEVLEYERRVGT